MQDIYDDLLVYGKVIIDVAQDGTDVGNHVSLSSLNGVFSVNGEPVFPVVAVKTSDYMITSSDYIILAKGGITLTLPTPTSELTRKLFIIKRINTVGNVTINSVSGMIDGERSIIIDKVYTSVSICTDGNNWYII